MNDVKYRFLLKAGESTGGSLPYGYQHVEYLGLTGTQYIDTGVYPNTTKTRIKIRLSFTDVAGTQGLFGAREQQANSKACNVFLFNSKIRADWTFSSGATYSSYGEVTTGTVYDINCTRPTITVNSVTDTATGTTSADIAYKFYIGNFANLSNTPYTTGLKGRIYSAQLFTNGNLSHNYIPARRLSDNVLGMYDTVTGTFLTNAGTGTFTAGEVVDDWTEVHPIWKDDLSIDYTSEGTQKFLRGQLSGNLVFVRDDFHFIYNVPFGVEFRIKIQKSVNFGSSWTDYWQGKFVITDCTINVEDEKITVKPTVLDRYTKVLAGWEKEFDLIKLTPAMQRFLVRKRPMIQIYTEGDRIVSCFMGNVHFEQDADLPSDVDNPEGYLRDDCHFAVISSYVELNFTDVPGSQASHFTQPYTGVLTAGSHLTNTDDSTYYIEYFERIEMRQTGGGLIVPYYINGLRVCPTGSTVAFWAFSQERPVEGYMALPVEITLTEQDDYGGDLVCVRSSNTIYGRVVCNVDYLGTQETKPLYNNDLVGYNRNYRRAIGYKGTNELTQYAGYSTTPTKWGMRDDGTYFKPPTDDPRYVPIGQSKWVNSSTWFLPSATTEEVEVMGRDAYTMNDVYTLASVIDVLLKQIDPSVTFADSPTYSEFLFNANQQDPIAGRATRLYITPKSNIVAGEYQTPAQTAPTTLKTVLDILANTYRLYWFIDTSNRLRIEHIEWFRRGGSYSTTPTVGIDLTTLGNTRNGKPWAFNTSEYTFDKLDMPDRYEFGWMDKVTDPFKGLPINVLSPLATEGKIEEVNVGNCTTDVDFVLLNAGAISQDGFVLMTGEAANAISRAELPTVNAAETIIVPVASYVGGKACTLQLRLQGSGTATIVWYVGSRRVVSSYVLNGNVGWAVTNVTVPDGTRGMSFVCSATCTITVDVLHPTSDTMLQMPFVTETFEGATVIMQNGELAFSRLQDPYWLYDMPAKRLEVNGTATNALGIARKKRQTVNVPTGANDPDTNKTVMTYLGTGQIHQMSVKLSTRMAKTTLAYDTEEL